MVKKTIAVILYLIFIVIIFKNWFFLPFLSGHDFPYFFTETLADYALFPPAWNSIGLGGETINYGLGIFIYFIVSIFVNIFNFPWELVYKFFIFGLFLFLSVFSSLYLVSKVLEQPTRLQFLLSSLIFTANTYILMVVDGGQVGVFLAYSIAPFVLARFLILIRNLRLPNRIFNFQFSIFNLFFTAIALGIQVMFDIRIAFITMGIVLFYTIYHYLFIERFDFKLYAISNALVAIIVFGLHATWLLPIISFRSHPAVEIVNSFSSVENLRFFSFATFSQTLSLLHPNWPENIFGKVYFMRPEFLVLPILAFGSLLFISKIKNQKSKIHIKNQKDKNNLAIEQFSNLTIVFFALLGLAGAFLAKGTNEPFGYLNQWMFQNIAGMSMFRDPTKFYLLTAVSYSVLIPFSVYSINKWLKSKVTRSVILNSVQDLSRRSRNKFGMTISLSFLLFTILYLLFLLRPVFLNQLSGTFAKHEIPQEYIILKNYLHNQTNFSRTLWVPTQQRYNFYSNLHPAISGNILFSATNSAEIISKLQELKAYQYLSNLSIKHVIIPYDSFGEIFVEDRKYNEKEYLATIKLFDKFDWLKKIEGFGKIAVYQLSSYKDHFWLDGEGSISYAPISPSSYKLEVSIDKDSSLIFTESYNPHWVANIDSKEIRSEKTEYNLNSFTLEETGKYNLTVNFSKEKYYSYGRIITLISIAFILFILIYYGKKEKL